MPGSAPGARPGIVLFAAILLVAVAALAIATATYVAAQADLVARARADAVRAQLAAESAVRAAVASWRATADRAMRPLDRRLLPEQPPLPGGARGRASIQRMGGDLYLFVGTGTAGAARARVGALVRVLAVRSFLLDFPGGVSAGTAQLSPAATLLDDPPAAPPAPWPASACDPGAADTIAAVFGLADRLPLTNGVAAPAGLGPIPWERMSDWADRAEAGTVTPAPVEHDGACDPDAPHNWGAPFVPGSACAAYFPLVFAAGDLRVEGGSGQGVLVVQGNLDLAGDAAFFGAIVVGGRITTGPGTRVSGAIRAASASLSGSAESSACALLRALGASPALGRPLRPGSRWWEPAF